MEKQLKNKRTELTKSLLRDYMKNNQVLQKEQAGFLYEIAADSIQDNTTLTQLYIAIRNQSDTFSDNTGRLQYKTKDGTTTLTYKNVKCSFEETMLLNTISDLIELTEHILPLGSLVQLRKELFAGAVDISRLDTIRVVITNRFVREDEETYYTYGGVVYPVANFNGKEILKFTPSLIEKTLHKGYQDEQEDAYVYLMKQELILEKDIHMAGFREKEVEHEC